MKNKIKTIAFDADDTLWDNLPHFLEAEKRFCELLKDFMPPGAISKELFKTEMENLHLYGYGVKGFTLCMVETILTISKGKADIQLIKEAVDIGRELLQKPVELLSDVETTLQQLEGKYCLVVATKGDLLDQQKKLKSSGLQDYFDHIEIMSDKKSYDYKKLLKRLNCSAEDFLMVGNSLKSDVLPVLKLGGFAAHVPYPTVWEHEQHSEPIHHPNFLQLTGITEILHYLN